METKPPKVFVSHAGEDKERFVIPFAEKLRANGVDAWIDKWEMLPGDSLVDKIFEEGIKNAQAMIIVLSNYSVNKKWVREELNAGMIKKISGSTKVIPVIIGDCEVPEALKSTVWETIKDLHNYDEEFQRIVASIFGVSLKPPIGSSPKYVQFQIDSLPNLNKVDTIVFKTICEQSLQKGIDWISTDAIADQLKSVGITEETMYESIEVFENNYFIQGDRTMGSKGLDFFKITTVGFYQYGEVFIENFSGLISQVLLSIINLDLDSNGKLSSHLHQPKIMIDYILDILSLQDFIKISKNIGGNISIYDVTVKGKRAAREIN